MYLYHFGLSELPFSLTPNTQFYLPLACHDEAMQVLLTALQSGEGFIKVTGEVGTGKTLLCRKLLNDLPQQFIRAYLPSPYLNPQELRWALAQELGLKCSGNVDQLQLTQLIQQQLIGYHEQGRPVVLVIDEAQALPEESLEALRLLTNLETESRKLLQVVLFGQQELDTRLSQPKMRQLHQRITFSYQLRAMSETEVAQYIAHRLQVAGLQGRRLFAPAQICQLYRASGGIPRLVNVLCHKALLLSFGAGNQQVSRRDIRLAVQDTESARTPGAFWPQALAVGTLVSLLSGALFYYWSALL